MTEAPQREAKAQVVLAPSRPAVTGQRSIFLAGTTTGHDWRETLTEALLHLPITIFNPLRGDWDSSWKEDVSFTPFREQVEWELDMQGRADLIVLYFGPATDAPIALLEFGLCARQGKAIAVCHKDYRKRGNVQIVSQMLGIEFMDADDDFVAAIVGRLEKLLEA